MDELKAFQALAEKSQSLSPLHRNGKPRPGVDLAMLLLEHGPGVAYIASLERESPLLYVSPQIVHLSGYTPEELIGTPGLAEDLLHPLDVQRVLIEFENASDSPTPSVIEYRMRHRDGRVIWVRDTRSVIRDPNGNQLFWQGMVLDITAQREAEIARDRLLHDVNERIKELTTIYEVLRILEDDARPFGDQLHEIVHLLPRGWRFSSLAAARATFGDFSYATEGFDTTPWMLNASFHDGTVSGTLELSYIEAPPIDAANAFLLDEVDLLRSVGDIISSHLQRREAQSELERSERRFRSLVQNASDIIDVMDASGNLSYVSPPTQRLLGYAPEEMIGRNAFEFLHPDDSPRVLAELQRTAETPGVGILVEMRAIHKQGHEVWIEAVANNLLDDPDVSGIVVNIRDISERKAAEAAIERSDRRFRAMIQHARDIVGIIDLQGVIQYVSPSVTRVLGFSPDEFIGRNASEFVHLDDMRVVSSALETLAADPTRSFAMTYRCRTKDGDWR
jgi:PAS domain S-box-containing protein